MTIETAFDGLLILSQDNWPRDRWPNFSHREMKCKHTGQCRLDGAFMDRLQEIRTMLGFGLVVTSGYRHPTHPDEASKEKGPGYHTKGLAVDIGIYGSRCHQLVEVASGIVPIYGIGLNQKGPLTGRFVHLDGRDREQRTVFTY